MRKFSKNDRSSWPYFWAHWCAFQMVAINLRIWKFKYLFHDWYKPWLKMFGVPYLAIRYFHRTHSKHHLEWISVSGKLPNRFDWDAAIIDWECSQYTKEACTLGARAKMEELITRNSNDHYIVWCLNRYMRPRLNELNL